MHCMYRILHALCDCTPSYPHSDGGPRTISTSTVQHLRFRSTAHCPNLHRGKNRNTNVGDLDGQDSVEAPKTTRHARGYVHTVLSLTAIHPVQAHRREASIALPTRMVRVSVHATFVAVLLTIAITDHLDKTDRKQTEIHRANSITYDAIQSRAHFSTCRNRAGFTRDMLTLFTRRSQGRTKFLSVLQIVHMRYCSTVTEY